MKEAIQELKTSKKMNLCSLSTTTSIIKFNNFFTPSLNHLPFSFASQCFYIKLDNHQSFFSKISCFSSGFVAHSATSYTAENMVEDGKLEANIQLTTTPLPNSRLRLSVEVPTAVCDYCYGSVIKEIMKKTKVPGFRPGKKVPENILINYAGKQNVQKAIIESILKRTLPHAVSSVRGETLKDSIRITTKFADMEKTYTTLNCLRYDVIVDMAPEVKWAPENGYKDLKVVVEVDSEIDAQTACKEELKRHHKALGVLKIGTNRGLQVGDVVVLDISATTVDEETSIIQKIPSAESKGFQFDTEDGDKVLPGLLDSIIGIQRGETRTFPFEFPESWKQEHLRGVNAEFTVECKELFYRDLPKLNDYIADKLLPGCNTIEEVKNTLLERCQELEKTAKEQAADNAILDQLSKMIEVDIPQTIFEEQGRELYGAQLLQVQANTKLNEQQLAYLTSPKAVDEYLRNQKENIINIIKQNLVVGDIFNRENLQVETEELIKEVENSIAEFKRHNQEYDENRVKEQVQELLEGAKVLEFL